ncbi:MAG: TIGR01440 family protein [Oscillospiraceae bacterium]|nr:TIGR01440 family protein [Oscillospiraceae bacterium]
MGGNAVKTEELRAETNALMEEFLEKAGLKAGGIVVVGCSTSEITGCRIGTNSDPEVAETVFEAIYGYIRKNGLYLAAQCCEHLNRALIIERGALPGTEPVNVVPQPKAGGSFATRAYAHFADPIAVEEIRADAGIDIGSTFIGMHLKKVAVPIKLETRRIGAAVVTAARTRPKFIGGARAVYDEKLL